ncbi:MAG TPA: MFS transporter [Polyangiaceae bacterium]|jgi:sugar phosphate permease
MVAASQTSDAPAVTARARAETLAVLWLTYGSFYFCRVNIGPAVPSIRHALGFSALEMGLVLGTVKLGYALGQLVNGQLTERFGPRRILSFGMIGSSAVTLLLAFTPSVAALPGVGAIVTALAGALSGTARGLGFDVPANPALATMIALAFANGWFQACGWPPCVKVAAQWFPPQQRGRMMGILGTSYTVGSAIAIAIVGALLSAAHGAWPIAFAVPALVLAASFVQMALRLRESPAAAAAAAAGRPDVKRERMPLRESFRATVRNPRIWVLAFGLFGLDAVRYGFLDWAPGHLAEVHHSGALSAALKTAVFPLAGALGTLSSGWLTDRLFQSRRAPVCAIMLLGVGVMTLVYRVVVGVGALPTVICLALAGFFLYGAQILLVGTAAQDFARKGATAAAAGFVDFMGHLGAFSGDVVTGSMLRRYGWSGAIAWWACAALGASALVATLWRVPPPKSAA